MVDQVKRSLTQRAITLPKSSVRTPQPPVEAGQATAQTTHDLPEDVERGTEEKFSIKKLNITENPPPEVALLHISKDDEDKKYPKDKYFVLAGNNDIELHRFQSKELRDLSLGDLVIEQVEPKDILYNMDEFLRCNKKLHTWLKNKLSQNHSKPLCLVIADYTDFEIPWEMLNLSLNWESPQYLGAMMTTVRWKKVINDNNEELKLKVDVDESSGNVVAYVLNDQPNDVDKTIRFLGKKLQAKIYLSIENKIKDFPSHLQQSDFRCGLVYIYAHGTSSQRLHEITLYTDDNNREQPLKLSDLYQCSLNLIKSSRSIVFINACHSARQQASQCYCVGFVKEFLAKGAQGVIGTLGPVGRTYAAEFAHELIEESWQSQSQSRNLSVAELLRDLRSKRIKKFLEPDQKDWISLIYTFMYVYYGNPKTVLRLTPPGGQDCV